MARRGKLNFQSRRTSGRAISLWTVFFILTLAVAPPIKHYFTQRAQISQLNAQLTSDHKALDKARKDLLLWKDPDYIKSQARERLHFVLPGERQYIVTVDGTNTDTPQTTKVATSLIDGQPWYTRLIASISETG
jgi:cell division protein FtsB